MKTTEIQLRNGSYNPVIARGYLSVSGLLALHRPLSWNEQAPKNWTISHLPTGLAIHKYGQDFNPSATMQAARAHMKELDQSSLWSQLSMDKERHIKGPLKETYELTQTVCRKEG